MTRTTTGVLRNMNINLRARYAFNMSLVLTMLFLPGVAITLYLARTTKMWQLNIISAMAIIAFLLNIFAMRYSRLKRIEIAAFLMVAGIILVIPLTIVFISGIGLLLGITGFIIIFMIGALTLIQPELTWAIISGIVLGIASILLDAFYPSVRFEIRSLTFSIVIISFLSIGIFGYYISQQFAHYSLRNKLIILFITIVFFSVGSVAVVTNVLIRNQIIQQVGHNQQVIAERLALEVGKELETQVENLLATESQFEEVAAEASASYIGTNNEITDQIQTLDQEWLAATDQSTLVQAILNNSAADQLRKFRVAFPDHVELFLTDKYGANIAATNRTSDYFQADEDWWKLSFNLGRGKVYIAQPGFDESSQTYAVDIAIPIYSNDHVVGILRSTYDVSAILDSLHQGTLGGTKEIDLLTANETLLTGGLLPDEELSALSTVMGDFGEITYKGSASLVSQQRVFSSENSGAKEAVSELGWSIIVHEDLDEALLPVQQQTRAITLVAVVATALVGLLGFYASQRLAVPIINLTDITRRIAEGDLSIQTKISTQDEIGELANSFNRMTSRLRDTLAGLERRVAERTADLDTARLLSERRAQELHSISEISRTISTEQRLEILLPLVTRLVSERFDFYHVGIFFVDDTRRFVYLQAANSDGGQQMLLRGHRLEMGKGLVGTVAQTGKPRIALDVGSDVAFFDNPDLPSTRSEMALPLSIRGVTIGVLDVQSRKQGAFSESDANTLGILADQVTIAIENARLFSQTQQARDEAEALYAQIQRKDWSAFTKQEDKAGYYQTATGGRLIKKPVVTAEIRQALESGQVIVLDNAGTKSYPSIVIPVKLRGQTLGVLNIKAPTHDRKWNQNEINLAQAISDRLALALDNARLLHESQRRAAKEAKIADVSAKIGASINMRSVLLTAVEELGRALPGSEVVIQFDNDQ